MIHKACMPVYMNSGKIVAGRVDGKIEGSTRGPRGPKNPRCSKCSHVKNVQDTKDVPNVQIVPNVLNVQSAHILDGGRVRKKRR